VWLDERDRGRSDYAALGLLLCAKKIASLKKLKEGPNICGADHWITSPHHEINFSFRLQVRIKQGGL
jgi:hypothetical protein